MKTGYSLSAGRLRGQQRLLGVAVSLQDGKEGLLGNLNVPHHLHTLLPFLLFLKKLSLSGYISAVTLGRHILSHRIDRLTGDDRAPIAPWIGILNI